MNQSQAQAFFEATARHLFAQGRRCDKLSTNHYDPSTLTYYCQYRLGNQTCAMGFHIPASLYTDSMDEVIMNIQELCSKFPQLKPTFAPYEENFLNALQLVHDLISSWINSESLRYALREVAKDYALNSEFLNGLTLEPTP